MLVEVEQQQQESMVFRATMGTIQYLTRLLQQEAVGVVQTVMAVLGQLLMDEQVVLVVFTATEDVRRTQELCASMRNRFGQSVPLLACVGRYVFPNIRPLLETDLQGLIMTPFDAREFREKLDQMELGF